MIPVLACVMLACGGSDHSAKTVATAGSGNAPGGTGSASDGGGSGGSGTSTANGGSSTPSGGSMSVAGSASSAAGGPSAAGSGCGSTARANNFEGRPRACVPTGQCNATMPSKATYKPTATPPNLPIGTLVDIGPPVGALPEGGAYALAMTFDPTNTATLYVGFEFMNGGSSKNGLWKSTDGGSSWKLLGSGKDEDVYDCTSNYLDMPIRIEVDPNDSNHLYVTEGVRGAGNGFWVSWDGGDTWTRAFSGDLTAMDVDPCDFCHVIVGSHDTDPIGVLETTDGGASFTKHPPPAGWEGGSYGVSFLYDPKTKQGDSKTWLVHNSHFWRTSDAGATWTSVSDIGGIHGFTTLYYASNGALFSGASYAPAVSTDNGLTWKQAGQGLSNSAVYYGLIGDGTNLYSMPDNSPPPQPMMMATESGTPNWLTYGDGKQTAKRGMQHPHYDAVSGILYFVNNVTLMAVKLH
ncbi:MAG TPA: hypothetical protein VHM25_09875 [Polyangiaceae bacterium]|jgi:photosystem II stability/assembly factor-like uncharacterized protein|nr:hypothetical protein [Polyangiaceae bacterium]